MKYIFSILFFLFMTTAVYSGLGKWTPTNGPNGGLFTTFIFPNGKTNIVFATGGAFDFYTPLYRSKDGGLNWQVVSIENHPVNGTLKADPLRPGRLLFGGGAIFETADWGDTWKTITNPLHIFLFDFEFDPFNSNVIYGIEVPGFAEAARFFKSSDGGRTWNQKMMLARPQLAAGDIEVDPSNGQTLYVVLGNGHVYKSTNGGNSFRDSSNGLPRLQRGARSLAIDTMNPQMIYSAGYEGIFKTTNAGQNWKSTDCNCRVREIDIDPNDSRTVYAAGRGDIDLEQAVKSTDAGQTWSRLNLPRFDVHPYTAIAVDPRNSKSVFASSEVRGIFRSSNSGTTWTPSSKNVRLRQSFLSADLKRPGHMLAIGSTSTGLNKPTARVVFETFNNGSKWCSLKNLDLYGVFEIFFIPRNPRIIVANSDAGLLVSSDSGKMWQNRGIFPGRIFIDPVNTNTIYAFGSGMEKSTDLGITWTRLTPPINRFNSEQLTDLAIDPSNTNILYATTFGSTDEETKPSPPGRLFKSTNAGKSWKIIAGKGLPQPEVFNEVKISAANPAIIYVTDGFQGGGISRSMDGGQTWTRKTGLPVYRLFVDQHNAQRLLAITFLNDALYFSNDSGTSWMQLDSNSLFPPRPFSPRTLATAMFSPWNPKTIYAAIDGVKTFTLP